MAQVWIAYDHVINYKVDLDEEEVVEVEIPGWMNTFDQPGSAWTESGGVVDLSDDLQERVIEILENQPMPEPYWG